MQEGGWIKLYRSIRKHWIWEDPQKLKWWLDILLQANHQEKKILLGNELAIIEKGSFHTSIVKLSERWKVDRKTVKKFLNLLQEDNMISLKTSKKGTTLKISNYNDYQAISEVQSPNKVDNSMDNKVPIVWTDKSQQSGQISPNKVDTNKNDKEYIKNNKEGEERKERKEEVPSLPPLSFPSREYRKIYDIVGEIGYRTWFMEADIKTDKDNLIIEVAEDFKKGIILSKYYTKLNLLLHKNVIVNIK